MIQNIEPAKITKDQSSILKITPMSPLSNIISKLNTFKLMISRNDSFFNIPITHTHIPLCSI